MLNIEQMYICIKASWIFKWIRTRNIKDYSSEMIIGTVGRDVERITWGELTRESNMGTWPILKGWFEYKKQFYGKRQECIRGATIYN
jgi:hypothetical protein